MARVSDTGDTGPYRSIVVVVAILERHKVEDAQECYVFYLKAEIKADLDYQLANLRTYNLNPRAPAQDMAGLQSTYGYDKSEITNANEMLKTGQVPLDVNVMPGLVEDMSDAEEGDVCYFYKKPGPQKRDCRKFERWKRKNPNRKPRSDTRKGLS